MASTVAAVPTLYTCFFAYADPLIALYGAYLNFLAPEQAVASMAPQSTYDPATVFLFHQAGGLALAVAVMSALVPRVSEDLAVWKVLQFSLLLSDVGGLSGVYFALERQGRLEPRLWSADDRAVGGLYLFITAVRLAFVLGVGFGSAGEVRRGDKRR
ncbi:uncharacterized protein G6M90_00g003550 [Metarhizium brunneum]|uniref:DUF7704 domain-containing protein n=1 Tax=Metarhizium brunneum TaxID=500148 RepID=A0A7D5UT44_9HYPO